MFRLVKLFIQTTVLLACFGSSLIALTRLLKSVLEVSLSDDTQPSTNRHRARSKDSYELCGSGLSRVEHRNEFSKVGIDDFFHFCRSCIGFLKDLSKDFPISLKIFIAFSDCIFPNLNKFLTIAH